MFSGIISDLGKIVFIDSHDGEKEITIATKFQKNALNIGCSIAHNGVCLTASDIMDSNDDDYKCCYKIWLSPETLERSNAQFWGVGEFLNLELSLRADSSLDGHFVLGHVDGVGKIIQLDKTGESYFYQLHIPADLMPLMAVKGSVALDGISLTINEVNDDDNLIALMIIPHTWQHTNLSQRHIGDNVNIEADPFARYISRYAKYYIDRSWRD